MYSLSDLADMLQRFGLLAAGILGLIGHCRRWWVPGPLFDRSYAALERERTALRQMVVRSYQVDQAFEASMAEVERKVGEQLAEVERFGAAVADSAAAAGPPPAPPARAVSLIGDIGVQP
jgi:hypothetical protein